jgi:hypothetical protein
MTDRYIRKQLVWLLEQYEGLHRRGIKVDKVLLIDLIAVAEEHGWEDLEQRLLAMLN